MGRLAFGADDGSGSEYRSSGCGCGCGSGEPGIAPRASSGSSAGKAGAAAAPLQQTIPSLPSSESHRRGDADAKSTYRTHCAACVHTGPPVRNRPVTSCNPSSVVSLAAGWRRRCKDGSGGNRGANQRPWMQRAAASGASAAAATPNSQHRQHCAPFTDTSPPSTPASQPRGPQLAKLLRAESRGPSVDFTRAHYLQQ